MEALLCLYLIPAQRTLTGAIVPTSLISLTRESKCLLNVSSQRQKARDNYTLRPKRV